MARILRAAATRSTWRAHRMPEAAKGRPLSEEELVAKRREIEERVAAARRLQTEAKPDKDTTASTAAASEAGPSTDTAAATRPAATPAADDDEDSALPGGYETGETVFHIGEAICVDDFPDLEYGMVGEIVGLTDDAADDFILVRFPESMPQGYPPQECRLADLSRVLPDGLPGGFKLGETVFYLGEDDQWDDGDSIAYGEKGEVTGSVVEDVHVDPPEFLLLVVPPQGHARPALPRRSPPSCSPQPAFVRPPTAPEAELLCAGLPSEPERRSLAA